VKRIIFFGPPGTGKTTTLLGALDAELKAGVSVEEIAFLTFTRRARHEAVERVGSVLGFAPKELPYFRTIHSMAYRALRLTDGDLLGATKLKEFGKSMGVTFGDLAHSDLAAEGLASGNEGDILMALDNLARIRLEPLTRTWSDAKPDIDWPTVDHFSRSYAAFKQANGVLDFTDVLIEFVKSKQTLPVAVSFIDEAQDLSSLQWLAVFEATANAERQYVAGDDDQAIYRWAGADVKMFMTLEGERKVLEQSYRLPRRIHRLATLMAAQIKQRVPKEFKPRDEDGEIHRHATVEGLDLSKDGWLWLVRNRYLISGLRDHLDQAGVVYGMHGRSSIIDNERDAIYTWERLRAGKKVRGEDARLVYKYLRALTQIKRGHKLLPHLGDEHMVSMKDLREEHGLLAADEEWYTILEGIPLGRRQYYRRLLRHHHSLKLPVQVQLETIHGAKGGEADRVALFLDMARRTYEEQAVNPDDEHRVWYVGVTRAKRELHVIQASGLYSYRMRM
jgi:DNA helicase-2/ATP-dependent DNA helicase PcrA